MAGFLSAFCPREGGGGGGKLVSVCKACGKLGGSGGHAPLGNFDLDLLQFGGIWEFSHTHNFFYHLLCH